MEKHGNKFKHLSQVKKQVRVTAGRKLNCKPLVVIHELMSLHTFYIETIQLICIRYRTNISAIIFWQVVLLLPSFTSPQSPLMRAPASTPGAPIEPKIKKTCPSCCKVDQKHFHRGPNARLQAQQGKTANGEI